MRRLGIVLGLLLAMEVGPAVAGGPMFMAFFERGRDVVTPQAMEIVRLAAEAFKQRHDPAAAIVVSGYTDRAGDESQNMLLSQRRADSVVTALASFGVPRSSIVTLAYGESDGLVETEDGVFEPRNNRVSINIWARRGG